MNLIIGMKEIRTPLRLVGLRFYKAYDGNIFMKFRKRSRKKLFSYYQQDQRPKKIAN